MNKRLVTGILLIVILCAGLLYLNHKISAPVRHNLEIGTANKSINFTKITVADLVNSSGEYVNKTVQLDATLVTEGTNYFTNVEFYLEDNGSKIPIFSFAPLEYTTCANIIVCKLRGTTPGPVMSDYIGKRLEITGVIGEIPIYNRINGTWSATEHYYSFVSIIHLKVLNNSSK